MRVVFCFPASLQAKLQELVAASQPGDVLFFHFSGHGWVGVGTSEIASAVATACQPAAAALGAAHATER